MYSSILTIQTHARAEMLDITDLIQGSVEKSSVSEGFCRVFIPHTTCGVTINENADPDVVYDMLKGLEAFVPWRNTYLHAEGNSAAHIKSSLMGFEVTIPVEEGRLILGTWQGVYLCEFDGPRNRKARVYVTSA